MKKDKVFYYWAYDSWKDEWSLVYHERGSWWAVEKAFGIVFYEGRVTKLIPVELDEVYL